MRAALLLSLVFVAGCFLDEMRLRGVPEGGPSWRLGYADGCQSGRQVARGQRKDEPEVDRGRYRADDDYRTGWKSGYDECFARVQAEDSATPTAVPIAAALPPLMPERAAAPQPPVPTAAAAAAAAPPSNAARRDQIQRRIQELRGEIQSLERELEQLPY